MTYSIEQIKKAWDVFDNLKAFGVLKAGKWKYTPMINGFRSPSKIDGTAAKTKPLKDIMGFPEYLEEHWQR